MNNQWVAAVKGFINAMVWYVVFNCIIVCEIINYTNLKLLI